LSIWQRWATTVTGAAIDCGHYLPEENPQATAKALLDFFSAH
jgi:haloacetate dehalogenase